MFMYRPIIMSTLFTQTEMTKSTLLKGLRPCWDKAGDVAEVKNSFCTDHSPLTCLFIPISSVKYKIFQQGWEK